MGLDSSTISFQTKLLKLKLEVGDFELYHYQTDLFNRPDEKDELLTYRCSHSLIVVTY